MFGVPNIAFLNCRAPCFVTDWRYAGPSGGFKKFFDSFKLFCHPEANRRRRSGNRSEVMFAKDAIHQVFKNLDGVHKG